MNFSFRARLIPALILALYAVPCLANSSSENSLRKDLASDNYRVRWDALEKTANPQGAKFVPLLLEHLKGRKDTITTVQTLGRIGPGAKQALPALCALLDEALKDPSPYDDNASLRPQVIEAITKIKQTPETTVVLRRALKHPVSTVRYEAAHALGEGGSVARAAIPDLQALSNDHEVVTLYVYPYGKDVAASAELAVKTLRSGGKTDSGKASK